MKGVQYTDSRYESDLDKLHIGRNNNTMIPWTKDRIQKGIMRRVMPDAGFTYSGSGEDILIYLAFHKNPRKITKTYIEIGTNKPRRGNNTYLFYLMGWRGLCVEANEMLIPEIKRIRPEDKVLCKAVGPKRRTAEFTIMKDPSGSTLEENGNGTPIKKVQVEVVTLQDCIKMLGCVPDFISIDTEGTDEAIVKSFDFKYRPYVWCVETHDIWENKNTTIPDIFKKNGYQMYGYTTVNTIFIDTL